MEKLPQTQHANTPHDAAGDQPKRHSPLRPLVTGNSSNKNQILSFIKNKRKLKRRKETEFQDRADFSIDYTDDEISNCK